MKANYLDLQEEPKTFGSNFMPPVLAPPKFNPQDITITKKTTAQGLQIILTAGGKSYEINLRTSFTEGEFRQKIKSSGLPFDTDNTAKIRALIRRVEETQSQGTQSREEEFRTKIEKYEDALFELNLEFSPGTFPELEVAVSDAYELLDKKNFFLLDKQLRNLELILQDANIYAEFLRSQPEPVKKDERIEALRRRVSVLISTYPDTAPARILALQTMLETPSTLPPTFEKVLTANELYRKAQLTLKEARTTKTGDFSKLEINLQSIAKLIFDRNYDEAIRDSNILLAAIAQLPTKSAEKAPEPERVVTPVVAPASQLSTSVIKKIETLFKDHPKIIAFLKENLKPTATEENIQGLHDALFIDDLADRKDQSQALNVLRYIYTHRNTETGRLPKDDSLGWVGEDPETYIRSYINKFKGVWK